MEKKECKVEGNSWSFVAISLAEGARGTCNPDSTASPSVPGTAVVQTQRFPKLFFKVNAVEIVNQKKHSSEEELGPILITQGYKTKAGHDTDDKCSRDLSPQDTTIALPLAPTDTGD